MKLHFISIVAFLFLLGCKKGEKLGNQAPDTYVFLDKIELSGSDRLNSIVQLHWNGEDKDGIVQYFEFSINGGEWQITTKTDSIFRLDLTSGADSSDIQFSIRAVDDQNLKDPSPASLIIPIKNTKPTIQFDESFFPTDTTYPVLTLLWNANDIDGVSTLDSVYLKVNNGNWISFSSGISMVTIIPDNPKIVGRQNAKVYTEYNKNPYAQILTDFDVDGNNQFYIKAKDKGGLFSEVDSSKIFLVQSQKSDIILVDGVSTNPRPITLYQPIINQLYGSYDYLDFTNASHFPKMTLTLEWWFLLHKEIFWYAPSTVTQLDYIERSEALIQNCLNSGKKFLFSIPVSKTLSPTSAIYRFSPIDSLTVQKDAFMLANSEAFPDAVNANNYPVLKNTGPGLIAQISPFYPKASAKVLYRAHLTGGSGSWND
ncbi:MAG: hypothetical protein KatS3mg035_0069 [Bacteroidia bacterium]|nr:MAG: hypothetical protein KatS3mg035_0069 [Bacteroidia bacterium]